MLPSEERELIELFRKHDTPTEVVRPDTTDFVI